MDETRFATLTKVIDGATERRGALKGVLAAALGLSLGRMTLSDASAKKKKKCPKPPACPTCPPACTTCQNDNGACCGTECCIELNATNPNDTYCKDDTGSICCTLGEGGGACDREHPYCCPPSDEFPEGSCSIDPCGAPLSSATSGGARRQVARRRR